MEQTTKMKIPYIKPRWLRRIWILVALPIPVACLIILETLLLMYDCAVFSYSVFRNELKESSKGIRGAFDIVRYSWNKKD